MRNKIVWLLSITMIATLFSGCDLSKALIAAGEALSEQSEVAQEISELQEKESEISEMIDELQKENSEISSESESVSESEPTEEREGDDDITANPPTGDVYDYGDGMSAGDYIETNYSSYQNCGVYDFGDKQGNIGMAYDNGITFFFESTQSLQSFSMEIEEEPSELFAFAIVDDINFDGYNDFLLPCTVGATNICYYAFVYEDWSGYFVTVPPFEDICNPVIDKEHQCITAFAHHSANYYEEEVYYWLDIYSLYRQKVRTVEFDEAKGKYTVTQCNIASDGRVGLEQTNEYTEEEFENLPALIDTN